MTSRRKQSHAPIGGLNVEEVEEEAYTELWGPLL